MGGFELLLLFWVLLVERVLCWALLGWRIFGTNGELSVKLLVVDK